MNGEIELDYFRVESSTIEEFHVARMAQPNINNPQAAIQLPKIRTTRRAQAARADATCPASSATTAKREQATPAAARPGAD
jgi:hypothetical protein